MPFCPSDVHVYSHIKQGKEFHGFLWVHYIITAKIVLELTVTCVCSLSLFSCISAFFKSFTLLGRSCVSVVVGDFSKLTSAEVPNCSGYLVNDVSP